jgi:hypothetical protein
MLFEQLWLTLSIEHGAYLFTGQIVDPEGKPVANATLDFWQVSTPPDLPVPALITSYSRLAPLVTTTSVVTSSAAWSQPTPTAFLKF